MTDPDLITGPVKIQISGPEESVIALIVVLRYLAAPRSSASAVLREYLADLGVALSGHADRPRNRKNQAAGTSTWEVTFDAKPVGERR